MSTPCTEMASLSPLVPCCLQVERISTFFKQRGDRFYPAWSFVLPTSVLRLVYSGVESLVFTCTTYFIVGLAPAPGR